MSKTNSKLASVIGSKQPKPQIVAANKIPKQDTVNITGRAAYSQDKWLTLLTLLNTSKLEPQYYRSQPDTVRNLTTLIDECAKEDLYLTCQCIVYSRCLGEGMRTISHAASAVIAPYISGQEYSKRFYGLWNKKEQKGGVIFRPDDMSEILQGYVALNGQVETTTVETKNSVTQTSAVKGPKLSNAMKKGFKSVLETIDTYSLLKYKSNLIDIINLVHPSPTLSKAKVEYKGEQVSTLDAIMRGYNVSANTWEVNQGNAGQIVAQAVKDGKIDEEEAKEILTQAKSDNWKELLETNKLGILACLRNLRNILLNNPDKATIDMVCALVSNPTKIREGKIFPYQIDLANEIMLLEFSNSYSRQISMALAKGYALAIPNLIELLPGNNLVMVDRSGSMGFCHVQVNTGNQNKTSKSQPIEKAALIAATIGKATNADIMYFGSNASYQDYNPNEDVFSLAGKLATADQGSTNLSAAWALAQKSGRKYDRVFILSDNAVNVGNTYSAYSSYVKSVGDPYVYSIDLAGYGTNAIAGDKVRYYYGYGFAMFDDIAKSEFNASYHLDKVRKVVI